MTDGTGKAPIHLWIVGAVSLLWNLMGVAVYTLTMMRHPLVMAGADPGMVAALDATPAWANGAWALGVWGALAGSFLLLARKRIAVMVFGLSLLGLIVVAAYEYTSHMPTNTAQNVVIWAIALFLLWYARAMVSRGVLR